MELLKEIKKLKFPLGSYVVVGSGHMIALGLKKGQDVDIVVTKDLFEKCKGEGWKQVSWTYTDKLGHIYLRKGIVELYLDVNRGDFNPATEELIHRATIIDEVPFASLEDMLKFKKEYNNVNPKHLNDIKLIEKHMEKL